MSFIDCVIIGGVTEVLKMSHFQVVNSEKFGLPQRRRRLYILGSPRSGRKPVMKGTLSTPRASLKDFLSTRRRERLPRTLPKFKSKC